jgi:YfiH family protein
MAVMTKVRFESSGRHLPGARAVVSERVGGVSEGPFASLNLGKYTPDQEERVLENERRALAELGVEGTVAHVRLEHGAKIVYAGQGGDLGIADALWTDRPGTILSLTVADCYPVAIVHGDRMTLLHCGWRGVAAGILEKSVATLLTPSHAGRPDHSDAHATIRAWIGPGICAACYPVGPEVAAVFPGSARAIAGSDRSLLDLRSEIALRLRARGLAEDAIATSASCTAEEPDRFFSHRRDGFPAGRMAAYLFHSPEINRPPSP